jgi:hypothetical protein
MKQSYAVPHGPQVFLSPSRYLLALLLIPFFLFDIWYVDVVLTIHFSYQDSIVMSASFAIQDIC